jgi:hypothetical protein
LWTSRGIFGKLETKEIFSAAYVLNKYRRTKSELSSVRIVAVVGVTKLRPTPVDRQKPVATERNKNAAQASHLGRIAREYDVFRFHRVKR